MIAVKNITIASLLDPPNHIQNEPGYQIENPPQRYFLLSIHELNIYIFFFPPLKKCNKKLTSILHNKKH